MMAELQTVFSLDLSLLRSVSNRAKGLAKQTDSTCALPLTPGTVWVWELHNRNETKYNYSVSQQWPHTPKAKPQIGVPTWGGNF